MINSKLQLAIAIFLILLGGIAKIFHFNFIEVYVVLSILGVGLFVWIILKKVTTT